MRDWRTGIGACLATIGALSIVLGPVLGLIDLGRPWSFLAGFAIGVITGLGATLSIAGLLGIRCSTISKW